MNNDPLISQLLVNDADRQYQVWERNSLHVPLHSERFFFQKFNYLHSNPLQPKWTLVNHPCDYKYSSAAFYETGTYLFQVLTHYLD